LETADGAAAVAENTEVDERLTGGKARNMHLSERQLLRYLDDQAFRYNNRKATDTDRFSTALASVVGRRAALEN